MLSKFEEYVKTNNYIEGLFVELSGLLFEVVLIVILVPILMSIINKFKLRYNVFLANFYTIQIMHDILDLLLEHFFTITESEQHKILLEQLKKDKNFSYEFHPFYGNIESKIFLLNYAYKNKSYKQHGELDSQTIELAISKLDKILNEIDQQIGTFSQLTKQLKILFGLRMMVYGFRDFLNTKIDFNNKKLRNIGDFGWEGNFTTLLQVGGIAFRNNFRKLKGPLKRANIYISINRMIKFILLSIGRILKEKIKRNKKK